MEEESAKELLEFSPNGVKIDYKID